ncbi:MAG TPA: hypothetical protein VMH39_07950 [Gemmatimonadaceae bacterium]|nr:hypothetical protein [Gemmatimonadaceae bacterium]
MERVPYPVVVPITASLVIIAVACAIVIPVARRTDGGDVVMLLFAGFLIGVSTARIEIVLRGRRATRRRPPGG